MFARSLSGEITPDDEQVLNNILQNDPDQQQQYDLLKRMWNAREKNYSEESFEEEVKSISHILQLVNTEGITEEKSSFRYRKLVLNFSKIAAVFILAVTIWILLPKKSNSSPEKTKILTADNGSRTRTILPDGSTVWVNAGSHISFSPDFKGRTRELTLDGEAYFDVVKNPDRPFIVHVSGFDIKVLGTAFNVKSYASDKTVETTLLRGLVQVTKQDGPPEQLPILLHPNEKLILHKDLAANTSEKLPVVNDRVINQPNAGFSITPLDSGLQENERIETAWVYNRLEFRGDNFEELALKLERWYNVNIIFDDEKVKHLSFNGSFQQETIEQALIALKTADGFNFEINGKEIHIKKAE